MPVIKNPLNAAVAASTAGKAAPSELVLQPGTIVDAQVLAARANLVKIAIAGMMIEVLSEVQLQPGMSLKLAVSQTADGVRLAVVDKALPDQAGLRASAPLATNATATSTARVIAPSLQPDQTPVRAVSVEPAVTLQAAAVSQAVRVAGPNQAGLSSLFANLPVIVASESVPADVRGAAAQLLTARPALTENLSADDVRTAFKASGVLLEASIAKSASPTGAPDLKAALVVFRQLVSAWASSKAVVTGQQQGSPQIASPGDPEQPASPSGTNMAQSPVTIVKGQGADISTPLRIAVALSQSPSSELTANALAGDAQDALPSPLAKAAGPGGPDQATKSALTDAARAASPSIATDQAEVPGARTAVPPSQLARALKDQFGADLAKIPGPITTDGDLPASRLIASAVETLISARATTEPSPPFRGSAPSAQPVALSSIDPEMPPSRMAAQLLDQTDGAIARQTLLQVASLPERFDAANANQTQAPRWAFEIPFATPQGTAVAQFEIAQDGGNGTEASSSKRIWRARFTLDIETTGPVHAMISLVGDKTTVRMWAERPDTAAHLRDNAQALDSALRQANLEPGDIVVQGGQPPQRAPARAGHFLDRAT